MQAEALARERAVIKEELNDLMSYLNGIPTDLRHGGAFNAYERRAAELSRELILSEVRSLAPKLPAPLGDPLTSPDLPDYNTIWLVLSKAEEKYSREARANLAFDRLLHWSVLATSIGSVVSVASTISPLIVPFSVATASLAAIFRFWRFAERGHEKERLARDLATLRDEIAHSFGPSGEVLPQSLYYAASASRIEQLLKEVENGFDTQTGA